MEKKAFPNVLAPISGGKVLHPASPNAVISFPHSPLSALTSPTVPGLPLCYFDCLSLVNSAPAVTCQVHFMFLIIVRISHYVSCSIHDTCFMSTHVTPSIFFSFIPLFLVLSFIWMPLRCQVSKPYVRTDRTHWIHTFLWWSGSLLFLVLLCA